MQFNYGFIYHGVRYGWHKKQLYRLPFERNNRTFQLKKIDPIIIGCTTCYNIQRNKLTINRIKLLTTSVDWYIEEKKENFCPF